MIRSRKFKIWLISFCIVLAVFLLYRIFGNFGNIRISKNIFQFEQTDMNAFSADSNSGRIGQAKLEYVERARFETVDKTTRKLKRVVGFEKVLHKTGDEWVLDKPYMNVYQENMRCDITANTGTVELENLEGANPVPKQAVLKGNVIVHILGQGKRSDSFIYLNEVAFDSDRSMLWSNNDVNFVSQEANLMGRGLEIVYNNATNRLEFLKIKKVDYLNINTTPIKTVKKKSEDVNIPKSAETAKTEFQKDANTIQQTATADKPTEPCGVEVITADANKEDYQCIFTDNVRIEYKEEVILADEISVKNLMWSQKKDKQQQQQQKPQQTTEQTAKPITDLNEAKKIDKKVTVETTAKSEKIEKPMQDSNAAVKEPIIATVKCDGPMTIRPINSNDYENGKLAKFKSYNELDEKTAKILGQRNLLIGEKVDYDVATETASARGKVELVFYPQVVTDTGKKKVPFIISANEGAEFAIAKKVATFSGNVKGTFVKQTINYDEENSFYGSKLIANLAEKKNSKDIMASSDISHITVLGSNVRLETMRTLGTTKLSHTRLKSERIDYDRDTQNIIATGKGVIEYGNTAKTMVAAGEKNLDRPCYTLVEGFTKLVWDTNTMHVRATSEKTNGIHIGYLPILETGYGQKTTIDTKQVDIDYYEPTVGKSQLKKLKATGGIVYYEQGGNEFAGKELNYNATDDYMTISGSDEMPCMLNGVFAEGIEYNLKTGEASAVLSGGVGIMPVR